VAEEHTNSGNNKVHLLVLYRDEVSPSLSKYDPSQITSQAGSFPGSEIRNAGIKVYLANRRLLKQKLIFRLKIPSDIISFEFSKYRMCRGCMRTGY